MHNCSDVVSKDVFSSYWKKFWGQPLPLNATQLPESAPERGDDPMEFEEDFVDGDLLPDQPLFDGIFATEQYIVRAEYIRIYAFVKAHAEEPFRFTPPAVIITGQPGIGEGACSVLALYIQFIHYIFREIDLDLLYTPSSTWREASHHLVLGHWGLAFRQHRCFPTSRCEKFSSQQAGALVPG